MSTKGVIFLVDDYLQEIRKKPELFWVAFSIITPDDDVLRAVDVGAPTATERLKAMKALSSAGVKTSLRLRPILPGISDSTKKHKQAYRELIHKAKDSGAVAISYECGFYPSAIPEHKRQDWIRLENISGVPLKAVYKKFGRTMSCSRPSYLWTEEIMHAIKEEAVAVGLQVGVSDPVWKQLGEEGCCCGISSNDPVFGNWEEENATNFLLKSRDTGCEILLKDIAPPWSYTTAFSFLCNANAGEKNFYNSKYKTWYDTLRQNWNMPSAQRSPSNYFQGALEVVPNKVDGEGNFVYKYKGLTRRFLKSNFWKV